MCVPSAQFSTLRVTVEISRLCRLCLNNPDIKMYQNDNRHFLDLTLWKQNKANLRDLIAATGLVILLKFDPSHRFFSPCDLETWWMTSKNVRAHLLYYIKICASYQILRWIQTEVTVRKRSIRVKIGEFFVPCDLEILWMTLENNRAPHLYVIKLCASF